MGSPLLIFWQQLFGARRRLDPVVSRAHLEFADRATATIFLIMRRMRRPLIVLIVIFSISVLGLALIPGVNEDGERARMTLFDAFYFMSYTATTIGFGELPWEFTAAQRLWVTFSIYLSVVGWAYAIGSLLTLLQDRAFRYALALQRFTRKVARLRSPFLLVAGYGRAGELLVKAFDTLGQQVVVIDHSEERIDALELESYHADIPGLATDASNPHHLNIAGLSHPHCMGVLALTNDDHTNLAVTIAAALIRPDLPVIARTVSSSVARRMETFGSPSIVNPFDRFGDHLQLALHAPASYQLLTWLEAGPGAAVPTRGAPPEAGRWVMCGYGRFGHELTSDLRGAGLEVTIIDSAEGAGHDSEVIIGDASTERVLSQADLDTAVGLVAGTDDDTTNLSMLANARRINPNLFLAARQNRPASAALFEAMKVDALLVPTEVVAHEVYAQVSTPLLWRFIQGIPVQGDAWSAEVVQRLLIHCGEELPALWTVTLNDRQAPALHGWLAQRKVTLGDLLRNPEGRERQLHVVPLLLLRGGEATLTPTTDLVLEPDDQLLFAGAGSERRELEGTLIVDATAMYVLLGERIPAGLVWRKLTGKSMNRMP